MAINLIGQVFFGTHNEDHLTPGFGDDSYVMTADNFVTDTVDGGRGSDTIDYRQSGVGVDIELTDPTTAGGASGGSVVADFPKQIFNPLTHFEHHQVVANLTSIENATGSNLDDVLTGNSQDNVLNGAGGNDVLTGGAGHDRFVFRDQSDSPAVPITAQLIENLDRITDFTPGQDHIDLRGLANETAGHAPLSFHGGAFSGEAGEIVESFMSNGTSAGTGFLVAADLDGDRHPDFEIFVNVTEPHVPLVESDFILH
jgi:Ca2+-binding RTX toxin-like protein